MPENLTPPSSGLTPLQTAKALRQEAQSLTTREDDLSILTSEAEPPGENAEKWRTDYIRDQRKNVANRVDTPIPDKQNHPEGIPTIIPDKPVITKTQAEAAYRYSQMVLRPSTDLEKLRPPLQMHMLAPSGFKNTLAQAVPANVFTAGAVGAFGAIMEGAAVVSAGALSPLPGIGALLISALVGIGVGVGRREQKVQQRVLPPAAAHAEVYLRRWLDTNYGIVPVKAAFEHDLEDFIRIVSNDCKKYPAEYAFKATDGETYKLNRIMREGVFWVYSEHGYAMPRKTPERTPKLIKSTPATPKPATSATTVKPARPVDVLAPFTRGDKTRIRDAQHLFEVHEKDEFSVENRFKFDRAKTLLQDVIDLGGKLDALPYRERREGFAELSKVITTVERELNDLDLSRARATLREAKILANYSRNLRPEDGSSLKL